MVVRHIALLAVAALSVNIALASGPVGPNTVQQQQQHTTTSTTSTTSTRKTKKNFFGSTSPNSNTAASLKDRVIASRKSEKSIKSGDTPAGILAFTRFNCAFPFCPTTALDVCAADEHFEWGRPVVLATLIPQTTTADMNFFAYSDIDNSTRLHYTLAARVLSNQPLNQLFTVEIAMNGTAGSLLSTSTVVFPSTVTQEQITYLFTFQGNVYVSFTDGTLLTLNPASGQILNTTNIFGPSNPNNLVGNLAADFDITTGTFYANSQGTNGFYLTVFNVVTHTITNTLGPLAAAPGTAGPGGARVDAAAGTMVVYPPAGLNVPMRLLEIRESPDAPWEFLAWLEPTNNGTSTQLAMPDEWYDNWDFNPNVFPDQWPGLARRVWSYDPVNSWAFFKMYDECGGADDCDENECIVYLEWMPGDYVDFYVAVEPVEPQLTQLTWTWTNVVN